MIYLIQDSINAVALTLNEKSEIYASGGTPYFLFQITNDTTNEVKYLIPNYVSANTRINLFTIEENITEDLSNGVISLQNGYYKYSIYEQTTSGNTNVNNTTGEIIETGKLFVEFDERVLYKFNSGGTWNNNIYYN